MWEFWYIQSVPKFYGKNNSLLKYFLPLSLIKSTQKSDEIHCTMLSFSNFPETVTQTSSNKDSVSLNTETLSFLDTQHV